MKTDNVILDKTYAFALKIVKLYLQLKKDNEFILSRQLVKSSTSIGANSEEGAAAQSKNDFISKFSIALKEARESRYWLRLLRDSELIDINYADILIEECNEIIRIITSIIKTARNNTKS
ncbi:MAG: four helix bundle protein [Bacteroidales bacterium]|nr:four helix bundle protein [Bacteroidales bacterium]MBN2821262.1 four helix bundle protein [Bacteroidales bacterium]